MKSIGIICEYNPFHNGHLYHIEKIKKMYPNHILVLVMSGPFTERGDVSILTKWEKAEIALFYGVDLVIELPFIFATGSADLFAKGAITILKELQIEYLIFGSEENDIQKLTTLALLQSNKLHNENVKTFLKEGFNYPTALSKSLKELSGITITSPNDLLGISYTKEIQKQNASIIPITIQRTNDYHSNTLEKVTSASSIRKALKEKKDINHSVPLLSAQYIHQNIDIENLFPLLKYKIISEKENLLNYHEVNEKLVPRMKKAILYSNSLDEFIRIIKTKSETYSKLKRICLYILCGLTKEEASFYKEHPYIRILGFTEKGRKYLNLVKKEVKLPFFSNYSNDNNHLLELDFRIHQIYTLAFPIELQKQLLEEEIKNIPKKDN
ncbi:MAG: nucleotidyltransferase [Bacilli bacterium]|nr:nucleotidyltransferase [Bacilli bacterium]